MVGFCPFFHPFSIGFPFDLLASCAATYSDLKVSNSPRGGNVMQRKVEHLEIIKHKDHVSYHLLLTVFPYDLFSDYLVLTTCFYMQCIYTYHS